ncbi:MAG: leucine-rich repeat protein [Eubacterium sp.]|nr:MAG: hypothetical protein DBY03_01435 [Clostridiales bacterium]
MKKILFIFLFLFGIVCFTNIQTSAASTVAKGKCGKNATWIISEDGVMYIKGKGVLKGEKNGWNKYQHKIKKIVIQKGITIIKETALASMHNIKEIKLPNSVKKIENGAFMDCGKLEKINIPSTVNELPNNIFSGCEKIEQITLPKKLKKIGAYAFYKCKRLKQITIPKTVTMLDSQAFVDCLSLTTIVNRSSKSLKLDDCKGKKKWKVHGKRTKILPGKKTAKTKKITFKITYDLRGGETMGELPSSYCYGEKVDLPDVVKPGYQFLGWKIFSFGVFSRYYHLTSFPKYCNQDIDFVAMFVKLDLLNLSDGELKVSVDDDKLQTKLEKYEDQDDMQIGYIAQISENEDMSKAETLWLSKNKTTELYENSFKNLKLGKRYYVRISYYYVDEYGEEDLKLLCPKWYLKQAVDIVR